MNKDVQNKSLVASVFQLVVIIAAISMLGSAIYFCFTDKTTISLLDNRELAQWDPEARDEAFKSMADSYLHDHAGYRSLMIESKLLLYGNVFNDFSSISRVGGSRGHIYSPNPPVNTSSEYLDAYTNMILGIQQYCDERNIPFIYLYLPQKSVVYPEFVPKDYIKGVSHHDLMLARLQSAGVRVQDATDILRDAREQGKVVFNKRYDVYHWSDLGAFTAMQWLVDTWDTSPWIIQKDLKPYVVEETRREPYLYGLKSSRNTEAVTKLELRESNQIDDTKSYTRLMRAWESPDIWSYRNPSYEDGPRLLALQDSYLGIGWKYLYPAVGEYNKVHSYFNSHRFQYYYNVFRPDIILYEQADYSSTKDFYNASDMLKMRLNPCFDQVRESAVRVRSDAAKNAWVEPASMPSLPEGYNEDVSDEENNLVTVSLDITNSLTEEVKKEIMEQQADLEALKKSGKRLQHHLF